MVGLCSVAPVATTTTPCSISLVSLSVASVDVKWPMCPSTLATLVFRWTLMSGLPEIALIVRARITVVSLGRGSSSGKIGMTMRQPFLGKVEWIDSDVKKSRGKEAEG